MLRTLCCLLCLSCTIAAQAQPYKMGAGASTVVFAIDTDRSILQLDATLDIALGSDSDNDASAIVGAITADIMPGDVEITSLQIVDLDLFLQDGLSLKFDYGFLIGSITVKAEPGAVSVVMVTPGPAVPVVTGLYEQRENIVGMRGTVNMEGTGLLGALVPEDPQNVDSDTLMTLQGAVTQEADLLTLILDVNFQGAFDVSGNTVTVALSGQVVGTGMRSERVASETVVVPEAFALQPGYPNPFNPRTTLLLAVDRSGPVRLAVFDALGRQVAVLQEGWLAAGRHPFIFEAGALPGGVYLVRAVGSGTVQTGRLVLLK